MLLYLNKKEKNSVRNGNGHWGRKDSVVLLFEDRVITFNKMIPIVAQRDIQYFYNYLYIHFNRSVNIQNNRYKRLSNFYNLKIVSFINRSKYVRIVQYLYYLS